MNSRSSRNNHQYNQTNPFQISALPHRAPPCSFGAPSKAALLPFSNESGNSQFGMYIHIYSIPEPRPARGRPLTQASPLCSRAKARFVNMLPRCSLVLPLCSLVLPLSHFLLSRPSFRPLRSCNFKRERVLNADQEAPYMASPTAHHGTLSFYPLALLPVLLFSFLSLQFSLLCGNSSGYQSFCYSSSHLIFILHINCSVSLRFIRFSRHLCFEF